MSLDQKAARKAFDAHVARNTLRQTPATRRGTLRDLADGRARHALLSAEHLWLFADEPVRRTARAGRARFANG